MNGAADRNGLQRKRVANFRGSSRTAGNFQTNLDADGRNDVALFAVRILEQSETGGAHRIILNGGYRRLDSMLVALEVDDTNFLLVTAANAAGGDPSVSVASAGFLANLNQRLLRLCLGNIAEVRDSNISR